MKKYKNEFIVYLSHYSFCPIPSSDTHSLTHTLSHTFTHTHSHTHSHTLTLTLSTFFCFLVVVVEKKEENKNLFQDLSASENREEELKQEYDSLNVKHDEMSIKLNEVLSFISASKKKNATIGSHNEHESDVVVENKTPVHNNNNKGNYDDDKNDEIISGSSNDAV